MAEGIPMFQTVSTNAGPSGLASFRVRAICAILGIYVVSFFLPAFEWESQYHLGFTAFSWSFVATPYDSFGAWLEFATIWLPNPLICMALWCLWRQKNVLAWTFSSVATCCAFYWVIAFDSILTVGAYSWSFCMLATMVVAMTCI